MLYEYSFATPAGTGEVNAVRADVRTGPGIVHEVEVFFPKGCAGLVHVRIVYRGHQVWPSNPGGSITGNDETIRIKEGFELRGNDVTFSVETWNNDDTFAHTPIVRFFILERKYVLRRLL